MNQLDTPFVGNLFQTSQYTYYQSPNPLESPVVFLSGLFAGDWIWEPTLAQLREKGRSFIVLHESLASIGPSIEALKAYIKTILDELNVYRSTIVGNSYGGLLAVEMAASFPERIQSIIISGSPGMGNTTNLNGETSSVPRSFDLDFGRKIAEQLFYDRSHVTDEMLQRALVPLSNGASMLNMFRLLKAERKYDIRPILPRVECETLLLWGQNDAVTPLVDWEHSQSLLKKSSLEVVAACGHAPMIEKPSQFFAIMWGFLTEEHSTGDML